MGTWFAPAEQLMINDYIIKTSPDERDLCGAKESRGELEKRNKLCRVDNGLASQNVKLLLLLLP